MPEVLRIKNIRFYFYSREHLPIHLHVKQGDKSAKIEVERLLVLENQGFHSSDLKLFCKIIQENKDDIIEFWNNFFREEHR